MHSPDLSQDNIAKIRDLFPSCVTEAHDEKTGELCLSVDFDQLRQELSGSIVEGPQERYRMDWPGKREALDLANTRIYKALRPVRDESVNFDTTRNLFIEGDNLEALKLLQKTYLGKIKMIYIDPPYNTGNDLIYRDNFRQDSKGFEQANGDRNKDGERLVANTNANGRFHSDWLTMITPRLRLARNLLTRDGAIFVSCDEGEQPRLRLIMDEMFGQSNFVADMVWAAGRKNDSRLISVSHEYIICYACDSEYLRENKVTWRQRKKGLDKIYAQFDRLKRQHGTDYKAMTADLKKWYRDLADGNPAKAHKHYNNVDHRGVYFAADISWPGGGGPQYEILHTTTGKLVRIPARGWMNPDPKKMADCIKDDRVHFGDDENSVPCIKKYIADSELETPYSVFYQDGRAASKRLRNLMGANLFNFPKDEIVLQEVIEMMTEGNDVILDFFAGSSTTAHSVILQNAEDGGNRKFIMVQLDEATDEKSKAFKAGFKTIPEISRERIRRAGNKILEGKCHLDWNKDIGFRVLKVNTSNMKNVYYRPDQVKQSELKGMVDNVKGDRTAEDMLFQVLLDLGVDPTLPIGTETIQDKTLFFVDDKALVACFDHGVSEDLVREVAKRNPLRAVFLDNGFASDAVKINVEQIFRQISPATEFKAI